LPSAPRLISSTHWACHARQRRRHMPTRRVYLPVLQTRLVSYSTDFRSHRDIEQFCSFLRTMSDTDVSEDDVAIIMSQVQIDRAAAISALKEHRYVVPLALSGAVSYTPSPPQKQRRGRSSGPF
jgi:hypothetical protein